MKNMKRCLNCFNSYSREYEICPYCGTIEGSEPDNDIYLKAGTVLKGRYIVGHVIGAGGFGITYAGWDNILNTKIAIKEYFPAAFVHRSNYIISISGQEKEKQYFAGLERFLNEARILAKFNTVEGIVHVNDYVEENNTAYIIMEFLEGITLKDYLKEKGKLTVDEMIKTIKPVINGLNEIHKFGLIHRDISTDNIIICNNGEVRLIDFGSARIQSNSETHQYSVILKPTFAPPEQYTKKSRQDARTDIYAIGAVMYNMITGQRPKESISRAYKDELIAPSNLNKNIPEWVESVVLKCLELDIDSRYSNADEVLESLNNKKYNDSQVSKKSSNKTGIIIVLIFMIVFGTLVYYLYSMNEKYEHNSAIQNNTDQISDNNYNKIEFDTLLCEDGSLLIDMYNPNEDNVDIIISWNNSEETWNITTCLEGKNYYEYWIDAEPEYGNLLELDVDINIINECEHSW